MLKVAEVKAFLKYNVMRTHYLSLVAFLIVMISSKWHALLIAPSENQTNIAIAHLPPQSSLY